MCLFVTLQNPCCARVLLKSICSCYTPNAFRIADDPMVTFFALQKFGFHASFLQVTFGFCRFFADSGLIGSKHPLSHWLRGSFRLFDRSDFERIFWLRFRGRIRHRSRYPYRSDTRAGMIAGRSELVFDFLSSILHIHAFRRIASKIAKRVRSDPFCDKFSWRSQTI